jgi:Osmosensitive K+ channel His kinase sensor domain
MISLSIDDDRDAIMQTNPVNAETVVSTEYFRQLMRKPRKGNLKVYMARVPLPGLFDTMVAEGKRLLSSGLDAAVALDGERTEADFPEARIVPSKAIAFKKSTFQELDCEAILRRSPEVVIIDNLLHVNISGSANEMRYQDVSNFLEQGINVITSAYSAFGKNLKNALDCVSGNFSIPFERWANLPADKIIALVFAPKESFHHAEVGLPAANLTIQ